MASPPPLPHSASVMDYSPRDGADPAPTSEQMASIQASEKAAATESAALAKSAEDHAFRAKCQVVKGLAGWIPPLGAALVAGDALSAFARGKDLCGDEKHVAQAIANSASAMIASRLPGSGVVVGAAKEAGIGWVADKVADNYTPKKIVPMDLPYIAANDEPIELLPFNDEIGLRLASRRAAAPSMEIAAKQLPAFPRSPATM